MIILVKDKQVVDITKELKALEKEHKLENVAIKKDTQAKKAKATEKEIKTSKSIGWKGFKKKHPIWFKTKAPAGKDKIDLTDSIAGTVVSLPFDYWSTSRHEMWKLSQAEEDKLAKAFNAAFAQYIPYFIKQFFPVITFFVLYIQMIESKRKMEAKLLLNEKLNEFSPRMQRKLLKKMAKA